VEAQDGAEPLLVLLLFVGLEEEDEHRPVDAEGGLDDVGDDVLLGLLVEVVELLAGGLHVPGEVVVRPAGQAPQLVLAEGEGVLDVHGALGVVGEVLFGVLVEAEHLLAHAEAGQPVQVGLEPGLESRLLLAGADEVLQLHLLQLPQAEDEVPRGDLVAEGFADLGDAEGELLPGRLLDEPEVGEDGLGRLGP
jgi:hypothetical protein